MVVAKLKVNNACEEEREMGTAEQQIQGDFLNMLTKEHVPVSVFLVLETQLREQHNSALCRHAPFNLEESFPGMRIMCVERADSTNLC